MHSCLGVLDSSPLVWYSRLQMAIQVMRACTCAWMRVISRSVRISEHHSARCGWTSVFLALFGFCVLLDCSKLLCHSLELLSVGHEHFKCMDPLLTIGFGRGFQIHGTLTTHDSKSTILFGQEFAETETKEKQER